MSKETKADSAVESPLLDPSEIPTETRTQSLARSSQSRP